MTIPYIRNHLWKKSFTNYLLCHSSLENLRDSGNLMYKNSSQDKKCKKTFTNTSRFTKFMNFFFRGQFPLYSIPICLATTWYQSLFLPVKFSYSIDSTLLGSTLFTAPSCFCLAYYIFWQYNKICKNKGYRMQGNFDVNKIWRIYTCPDWMN